MTTQPLKCIAYVRCSTQEQATDGLSVQAQRHRLAAWAEVFGAEIVKVVEDAGVSGSKHLGRRRGGAEIAALLDARHPGVDAVVVVRLDRLGRNAAETLGLINRFRGGRVGLISVEERLDFGTPQGRAMAGMALVFAELEKGLIGQRTSEALEALRSEGRAYGPVPFGWDRTDDGRLVTNSTEQKTIRRITRLRTQGLGYHAVADALNREGRPPKRAAAWSAMAVRSVIKTASRQAA
jgi:site-specific DNA recombinase